MAVETGRRLYSGNTDDGSPTEELSYTAFANARAPPLDPSVVSTLVSIGRDGIRRFYADCAADASLVEGVHSFLRSYCGSADALDPCVTTDRQHYPRVEVREGNGAVVFVGVPAALGRCYFHVPSELRHAVDGKPTGRYCFDCVPSGLSKALVVDYLTTVTREVALGRALAIGDQPSGNDEGLTRWHGVGLPFVSVAEHREMVPTHLADLHVTRVSNVVAAAAVLESLARALSAMEVDHEVDRDGADGPNPSAHDARGGALPLPPAFFRELVRGVNARPGERAP
jgi:hypothetical protein